MGVIKDGINHICRRLDEMRELLREVYAQAAHTNAKLETIKKEIVTQNNMLNDFFGTLEERETTEKQHTLTVRPAETTGKDALFVVSGDELAQLLEACSGATLRMKKSGEKETE